VRDAGTDVIIAAGGAQPDIFPICWPSSDTCQII